MTTLDGVSEVVKRLNAIGVSASVKAMRSAARKAVSPVVAQMRASAPIGQDAHRTYKGRLVAPSFLKRSIRVITRVNRTNGTVSAIIGTRREAFYGVQFYDQGPITITQRRVRVQGMGRRRRVKRSIKPYTLRRIPFFQSVFVSNRAAMELSFSNQLRAALQKALNGN